VDEIEATLHKLHELNDEQLVVRLDREPGKRDARYAHLFSGEDGFLRALHTQASGITLPIEPQEKDALERITQLEEKVMQLTEQLSALQETVEILSD
jgi:uncharacterized protein YceH (UPF0502 family)